MRVACKIVLSDEERKVLEKWARGRSTPARVVKRARIVLLAAEGRMNRQIGIEVGTDQQTVTRWRRRFARLRLAGIQKDAPRGGRPASRREAVARQIIERTIQSVPAHATHWSVRTMAKEMGVSPSMVHRIWRANNLKPHVRRPFKISRDPRPICGEIGRRGGAVSESAGARLGVECGRKKSDSGA